jgi:hypothetical protein
MSTEEKFAGTSVKIDDVTIAKVTSLTTPNLTITESEITGAEDVASGGDILQQKYSSIAVGETANVEGIVITDDAGQSALKAAARTGATVDIEWTGPSGNGGTLEGFFTSYQENRVTTDVAKFSGGFRVNDNTEISAGS